MEIGKSDDTWQVLMQGVRAGDEDASDADGDADDAK